MLMSGMRCKWNKPDLSRRIRLAIPGSQDREYRVLTSDESIHHRWQLNGVSSIEPTLQSTRSSALKSKQDHCYELIRDKVAPEDWQSFSSSLPETLPQIPDNWQLNAALRHRFIFQIQYDFFNPDLEPELEQKRNLSEHFIQHFLDRAFLLRWRMLMQRLEDHQREKWILGFCQMNGLLELFRMEPQDRMRWLMVFDTEQKFGKSRKAKVIKTKSLGLESTLLGVTKTMDWEQIKSRYRYLLKAHHPDRKSNQQELVSVQEIVEEFQRLTLLKAQKDENVF